MSLARLLLAPAVVVGSLAACGGSTKEPSVASSNAAAPAQAAPGTKFNANTASESELRTIPGVGEKIADEIMEYRPYDATTGEAKFRRELAKYISADEVDKIIVYLTFGE